MSDFFVNNIYTVILFPLWIFLVIVLGRFFNVVQSKKIISMMTLSSTLYGFVFALGTFVYMLNIPDYMYESTYPFLKIEDFTVNIGVYIDNLSIIMLLVITSISFIVQLYSTRYMADDRSFPRFFGYLNFFNFSMIGLVLSPNLIQNYVFWELVGVSSYLLIGFWYKKPSVSDAAKKAFLMNRIGDFALLTGTISILYFIYQFSGVQALAEIPFSSINDVGNYLYSYTNEFVFVFICVLILFGPIAKSAQFPLHTWLADAMEGPTPVSALIHSATMVAAGVYLIARLYPIFSLSETVMLFISIIGLITALICAYFAITQNDFKRILAYSTNSQLGLMFLALGLGAYSGGMYHLVTHAYFKSMLFLCSGIVIHALANQQDIRFMGGLRKKLPIAAICFLIGCFSISGILFSGFYSKEMILSFLLQNNHFLFSAGFLLVSLMTAFYMFRTYFMVFEGEFKSDAQIHKPDFVLNLSISILAFVTLVLGCITHSQFEHFIQFGTFVAQNFKVVDPVFLSVSIALLGVLLAFLLYNTKVKPIKIPVFYQLSYNKMYIDNFYDFLAKRVYLLLSRICAVIDKYIVDGLVVFVSICVRGCSWVFAKLQTGNFQSYLAYSVIFLALAFAGLMFAYMIVINLSLVNGG